ncbi:hypothetical protein [Kibdelosporangium phytohabitans]|uniref:Uncharacterized protein n=1 Tax=Kibdelosporangium phytohabitans TaxID=860235 RepID=A0A0N9IDQ8_9PSEU|nr:hypothetical protein [Kibdelosporangium phytohabitans]ALG13459.1 hypothetical protein AOZ06_47275 [Kibdelosporangium phytohabitans]MBE1465307.1 hypothetical protein [Kibdelosporangium phytohabitans]
MLSRSFGLAAGLCVVAPGAVEAFTGETAATSFVVGFSPALALPLLVGLHLRQRAVSGAFGEVAYTLNLVGLGLFGGAAFTLNLVLFHLGNPVLPAVTRFAFLGSAVVFAIGAILFGVAMLRGGVHPKVPVVAYMVAFPLLAVAARLPDTPLTSVVHVIAGGSLIWLAWSMAPQRQLARTS